MYAFKALSARFKISNVLSYIMLRKLESHDLKVV